MRQRSCFFGVIESVSFHLLRNLCVFILPAALLQLSLQFEVLNGLGFLPLYEIILLIS